MSPALKQKLAGTPTLYFIKPPTPHVAPAFLPSLSQQTQPVFPHSAKSKPASRAAAEKKLDATLASFFTSFF